MVQIGKAAKLPIRTAQTLRSRSFWAPGETAVAATGRSPIGVSFKINSCSGYIGTIQAFTPAMPASCPSNIDDARRRHRGLEEQCLAHIAGLPSCSIYTGAIPAPTFLPYAQNHIRDNINYNSCADLHRNDQDFYKTE